MATTLRRRFGYVDDTVLTVSVGHLVSHFYLLVLPPLFPALKADLGLSNSQLGILVAAISVSLFVLQTPVGALVDRIGGKRVFVLGTAVTALGIAGMAFTDSYLVLVGLALVSGVGQAAYHPADYALLSATAAEADKGKVFSVHLFGGHLGFVIAPVVVGTLVLTYHWQTTLLVVGLAGVGYALLAQLRLSPVYLALLQAGEAATDDDGGDAPAEETHSWRELPTVLTGAVLIMFVVYALLTFGAQGVRTFTALFVVDGFGFAEAVGNLALTAFTALTVVGVLGGGVLVDRLGAVRTFAGSLLASAAVAVVGVLGVAGLTPGAAVAVFGALGLVLGVAFPARDRLLSLLVDADRTGSGFGFVFTGLALGAFVGPALFGGILDFATVEVALALTAVGFVAAALLAVAAARR